MTSILERHRERFQTTPGDTQAFESLEEHLFLAGDWDAVIALYEHRMTAAAVTAVPSELSQVRFRMAQVIHDQLGDENRAIACYSEVLRDDPRHRPALMQLRRIHTRAGRWDVAVQLAEMECELPMGPEERAGLLCDMGCIWLDQLDDPQQALAQFERALEEHPEQRGALEGAARALERCDRHRDAAANWERLAAQLKGEARAEANVALAKIVANDLREVDRARGLYRDALGDNPNNLEAIRAVAEEAEKRQQWRLLADLRERQYELLDDAGERVSLAVELAELHRGPLDNRQAAHMWFSRAAELGSESPDVYEALADHEREHGYDDALLQCLERALALRGETAPASLVLEVATLYADRGDDEHALAGLQRAAELSPEDALVVDALSETLSRLGRDEELVDVLERRAGLVTGDASAHAAALADLAQLHEERLGDPDAACQAYQRAFAVDPSAPEIAAALERSLRKREDWDGLRDFLSAAGAEGPQCERVGYLCALAALERDHCGDIDAAKRAFEAALLLDPVMAAAHRGLQDLAAEAHDEQGVLRALQREADVTDDRSRLATLAPEIASRLEGQDRPEEALAWVERWVTACPDDPDALIRCAELQERLGETGLAATLEKLDGMLPGDARAANRRRLAAAHTACGRIEDAIASYRRALEADPADTEALEAIAVHLESEHRLVELAEMRRRLAELLPPEKRAACLDDLARLFSERLGDVGGAIAALQQLVATEHPPSDAHERLEALLERGARYEELVPYLAERTQALPADSPERTAAELKRADVLLNHLGRFDEAVAGFRAVCDRLPENRPAREGLSRALRAAGDPQPLADFLADEMENASEPKTREWCAFERAVLLEESLGRADEANAGYRRLLDRAVGADVRHAAAEKLEILLERTESWGELRDHIAALRSESDGARAAALDERLGRLCRDRLGDRANAITHLRAAADAAPERADLWRDLGELYAAAGSPADAVDAVEAELACAPDRERELALRARAAASCARDLRDPERARVHYERLLELEPSHAEASEFLIDYCQRNDEFASVARLLEARLAGLDGAPREDHGPWAAQRASLRVRIAGLRASQLDDLDGAIAILEPALGEIGPRAIVAEPLADLYQRAGYSEDLIELCRGAAARCQEAAERANWNVRQGDALQRCGRDEEAAESYRLALTDRPEDREVQAALRDLYRRSGEEEALTRLLEVELSHLAGAEEIPARLELAGLLSGAQNRSAEALTHVRRVLQIEPGHSDALEQALALAEALSLTDVVIALFDGALEVTHPPMARAALLSRRAQVLAGLPGRRDDAVIGYREALTLDPARSADRTALRSLLTTQGDWQGVLDCLHQEATGGDDASRARLFEMGAEIAWQRVSPDAALPWLERLRSVRPGDPDVLTRVCEVHRLADHPEALLHALETAIETLPDTRALRLEAADLLENRLGAPARAVAALEGARRESPQDVEILRRLARLYASLDRHRERAAVLEVLIARSAGESRLALLRDIADLYAGPLGDPQRAAEHLLDAVSAARGKSVCVELLRTLGDALRAAKRTEAWARCAEQELRTLDPDAPVLSDRRRLLRRELAVAYEEELGRPDAALRHLRALLALKWSEAHGAGGDELDAIENAALRLLRCEGSWIELCDRLETHLERRPDDPDRWLELARLREERLRSPAAARDAYEATLDRRPDDIDAIRGLRRCAELLGDWEGVRRILQRELDVAEDLSARERSALLRRLGDVSWHRLESTTLASRSYASALEASPQDFASLRSLQRLLEAMEDWRGALDLYESEVEMLGDEEPERRQQASLRAGEIARDHTDEIDRALRAYIGAAEIGPLPPGRRAELALLHHATGDAAAFALEFERWCDDPESGATAADHVRLAKVLEELARADDALARIERAVEVDPGHAAAWDTAANLREVHGDVEGAADALVRAADLLPDGDAAPRLLRAGELTERRDLDAAESLYRASARRDAANPAVCAALARVCAELGDFPDAVVMAERALDIDSRRGQLEDSLCVDTALIGARAANQRGNGEAAARLYARALAVDPDHADALGEYGETLAGLGDLAGARAAIETRLGLDTDDEHRALHLAMLGAALVAAGETEAATQRLEEAIAVDPSLDRAHEELVALHERAQDVEAGVPCLERWADAANEAPQRALRLLRAAAWEIGSPGREESSERHLRQVLEVAPEFSRAWTLLATFLWDQGRGDDALEIATQALASVCDPDTRGRLALIQGRALEQRGDRREAAGAFVTAAVETPDCIEAALSAARLLRGLGEWQLAADTLRAFAENHPGGDVPGLADVLQQLGRLLAGPLEDVDGAIAAYRSAVDLDPERVDTRTALAEFLSHRSGDLAEALSHHRALLETEPTHAPSLRVLMRLSRERDDDGALGVGLAIVRALGIAAPHEQEEEAPVTAPSFAGDRCLTDPLREKLRRLANKAAKEIATALDSAKRSPEAPSPDPASTFRAAARAAEGELTASALLPLDDVELAEVLKLAATLALDPDQVEGDGRLVNAMATAIRRGTARRLRKILNGTSLEEINATDIAAWRIDVRALAAAVAVDETGADLRTALMVLIAEAGEHDESDLATNADLTPFVAAHPLPRALLRRAVHTWLEKL